MTGATTTMRRLAKSTPLVIALATFALACGKADGGSSGDEELEDPRSDGNNSSGEFWVPDVGDSSGERQVLRQLDTSAPVPGTPITNVENRFVVMEIPRSPEGCCTPTTRR